MEAISTAIMAVIDMILDVVTRLFGFVTNLTPAETGGIAVGHLFFIGLGIALLLVGINMVKRLIWGA